MPTTADPRRIADSASEWQARAFMSGDPAAGCQSWRRLYTRILLFLFGQPSCKRHFELTTVLHGDVIVVAVSAARRSVRSLVTLGDSTVVGVGDPLPDGGWRGVAEPLAAALGGPRHLNLSARPVCQRGAAAVRARSAASGRAAGGSGRRAARRRHERHDAIGLLTGRAAPRPRCHGRRPDHGGQCGRDRALP